MQVPRNAPVYVLNTTTKRETGTEAQMGNVLAATAVADIVRTCLGPKAMLKMLLTPMGSIILTNDGNAILREIDVSHPAAKSMIELSKTQDEEVGDGTTSVIILAGEMLTLAAPWLEKKLHPITIIGGYFSALQDALELLEKYTIPCNPESRDEMLKLINSCIGTKYINRWADLMTGIALDAVQTVVTTVDGKKDVDIKRFAKVEKIPGGRLEDSEVIKGVVLNKDVTHTKMKRRIENPRIVLLDCTLEYKKLDNPLSLTVDNEEEFEQILKMEEEYVKGLCDQILKVKPDLVITEKGISDLAQHFFVKAGVTALRRLRKTDNNRLARATGAKIVTRPEELKESDVGTNCGLFEVRKIGDEYYSYITECKDAKACTILLRGGSKDILNEVERNLQDALQVAKNIVLDPRLVPGGGAVEMALSRALSHKAKSLTGVAQWPYQSAALAFEVIPRTLANNCGADTVRLLTALRAKHEVDEKNWSWGIDGNKGELADMHTVGIWEPIAVKAQTIKTAIESAAMLLRVDTIASGTKKKTEE